MHNKLVEILEELNIPIGFQKFEGEAEEYIIFNIYDDEDSNFFDNENLSETYYICINYWTTKKSKLDNYKKLKLYLRAMTLNITVEKILSLMVLMVEV